MYDNFEREKKVTNAFLKSRGIPQFKLIKPEIDPPDVIVEFERKRLGIEVRALGFDQTERIIDKEFNIIFSQVREQLNNSRIGNLVIRIKPEKNRRINRDECVDVIVNTCQEKYEEIGPHRTELTINPVQGISKITAYRPIEKGIIITFDSRGKIFGPLYDNKLKPVIEDKIKKLNKSRSKAPEAHNTIHENWLLMTVEGTFYENYSGINNNQVSLDIENCFDKIFVYHERKKWIEEIKTVYNNKEPNLSGSRGPH